MAAASRSSPRPSPPGAGLSLLAPAAPDTHPLRLFRLGVLNIVVAELVILFGWAIVPVHPSIAAPVALEPLGAVPTGIAIWILAALACADLLRTERLVSGAGVVVAAALLGGPTAAAWVALLGTFDARELRGRVPWYGVLVNHAQFAWTGYATGAVMLGARALGGPGSQALDLAVTLAGALVYTLLNQAMGSLLLHARTGLPPSRAFGLVPRYDWNLWVLAESAVAFLAAVAYRQGAGWAPVVVVGVDAVIAVLMRHQRSTFDLRHHPLTGLPNGLGLREHALEVARVSRPGRAGGAHALYLDLDRFKAVNDTFGHDAGDEVLRAVGVALGAASRPDAFAAHLHGDEFVVLVTGATEADAARLAGEVETIVARAVPPAYALDCPVAASVGHAPVDDLRDLRPALAAADRAMLANKERRRVAEGRERRLG